MKVPLHILIFTVLSLSAVAQQWPEVYWLDSPSERVYSIYPDSTLRAWNGEYWETTGSIEFINIDTSDFVGVERLVAIRGSKPLHFTATGTQQVYIYDDKTNTFYRDDATYHRGYNFQSIKWWRNDTLFSLGGYGFWHTHGILSYYSNTSKEWHVIPTKGGPLHITDDIYHFSDDGTRLYFTYSSVIHGSDTERQTEVWSLNLKTKKWTELGVLNEQVLAILKSDRQAIPVPFGILLNGEQKHLIDLQHNRIDLIESSVIDLRFRSKNTLKNGNGTLIGEDYLLDYHVPRSSNIGKSIGFRYEFAKIDSARRNPEKVYLTGWPLWIWGVIIAGSCLLIFILIRVYLKLRQPFLKGSTVQAEEGFFQSLDKQEVTLLRALLRSEMRGEGLQSGPITEIMGWEEKSWDNQRKWRNNLIKELNRRAQEHLNIEQLIYREKNPHDKRERVYKLNPDGFRLLRDSLHFTS
ncbi:hypothetical protein [Phaeocystidibacter luteus]|uniref:DUF4350 domain-containing protein n=1 Tax=Phaeocystidibacter luteus TaxID=911197 RepID=A0A6N6RGB6_9FLAO|nr:hypothetical protein [Phaeocystidibacter luteus]KAB2810211.1 hypothetical protein F8C67_08230 [Phaeocystidibacter luteus]